MIYVKEKNNKTTAEEKTRGSPREISKKAFVSLYPLFLSLSFFILLLLFPSESSKGASEGISLCINTLLPSLFPFMFVSSLFTSAVSAPAAIQKNSRGLIKKEKNKNKQLHSKSCQKESSTGFAVNKVSVQSLVIAAVGGYPVGAVTVNDLYKKGLLSEEQARLMIYTAFGGGMGFLISYTGASLLSSRKAGLILFSSQLITMGLLFLIGIFIFKIKNSHKAKTHSGYKLLKTGLNCISSPSSEEYLQSFEYKNKNEYKNEDKKSKDLKEEKGIFSMIFTSALSAGKSAVNMCLIVILFSSASGIILPAVSYNNILRDCFYCFWEVSAGVKNMAYAAPLWLISFITGFGGFCVHAQVFYAAGDIKFSKAVFVLFRAFQGLLNSISVFLIALVFPIEERISGVFSSVSESPAPCTEENPFKFFILIFACFCFLFSLGQRLVTPRFFRLINEKFSHSNRR